MSSRRPPVSKRDTDTIDPDDDVLELVRQGKLSAATALLMQRYGVSMFRYACAQVRDPALAEDVQQVVFMEVMRDLPRFMGDSTLRVWVFAIARHRVLDAVKKRRRMLSHHEDTDSGEVPALQLSPGDSLDDARLVAVLYACLDKLTDKARTAVLMHYVLGLTFEDMSKICHEKPGTLHARVARALDQLRTMISRASISPGKPARLPRLS